MATSLFLKKLEGGRIILSPRDSKTPPFPEATPPPPQSLQRESWVPRLMIPWMGIFQLSGEGERTLVLPKAFIFFPLSPYLHSVRECDTF